MRDLVASRLLQLEEFVSVTGSVGSLGFEPLRFPIWNSTGE
jgi:hypothetical protein